jgi:glucose/arabinose dehydrogenase
LPRAGPNAIDAGSQQKWFSARVREARDLRTRARMAFARTNRSSLIRSLFPFVCGALLSAAACTADDDADDDDASVTEGDAAVQDAATDSGEPEPGDDAGNEPDDDAGGDSDDDGGIEPPEPFMPEPRPPTEARIEQLEVPDGFELNVYARDLGHARMLSTHGEHVYLTRPMQGDVLRLVDDDEDGVAESYVTVASGFPGVHGIAFRENTVYLATPTSVYRASVASDGAFGTPGAIISDLPDGGQHPNRTLGIGPDDKLYISVGSSCNACPESNPEHATLLRAELDGSARTTFARGLRNTIGFAWHPQTGALWGMDHGSDWLGDDIPPEELNRLEAGGNYGWPYCYGDREIDPVVDDPPDTTKAAYCTTTLPPVLTVQAHNAPIAFTFYEGTSFPVSYRDDAFIALRGSWNRSVASGYKIVRLTFDESGSPSGFEDFVTGFLIEDGRAEFGRLAGITVAPDGALLFTDDENGSIYRVQAVE